MITNSYSAARLAALAGLVFAGGAQAASSNASTATGSSTGKVVAPIVLTHTTGAALNFGSFSIGTTGGKVDVTPAGVATVTKQVTFAPGGTTPAADQFVVTGEKKTAFTIATTGGSVSNGTSTMTFTTTSSVANASTGKDGVYSFTVGGKLTVAGTETGGAYSGSYTATVAYD